MASPVVQPPRIDFPPGTPKGIRDALLASVAAVTGEEDGFALTSVVLSAPPDGIWRAAVPFMKSAECTNFPNQAEECKAQTASRLAGLPLMPQDFCLSTGASITATRFITKTDFVYLENDPDGKGWRLTAEALINEPDTPGRTRSFEISSTGELTRSSSHVLTRIIQDEPITAPTLEEFHALVGTLKPDNAAPVEPPRMYLPSSTWADYDD